MTAVNLNRAIRGPVTAIPVVAGNGVRFVEDVPNNRVVAEADETVLWEGTITSSSSTGTLSETVSNFNKIKILCKLNTTTNDAPQYFEFTVDGTHEVYSMLGAVTSSTGNCYVGHAAVSISGTTITYTYGNQMQFGQAPTNNKNATIYKVVGVNRIASN